MTTGENMCAMSVKCEGRPADRGLMCREHREQDQAIHSGCDCPVCTSDMARIAPCMKDQTA
jgi:hypothetical protein